MKEIYGICSGSYEDWTVDYLFESEEKRDVVLKCLGEAYSKWDINLSDNNIDFQNIKEWYLVEMEEYDSIPIGDFRKYNSIQHLEPNPICIIRDKKLNILEAYITNEEFKKGYDYYQHKWSSIWDEAVRKVKEGANSKALQDWLKDR